VKAPPRVVIRVGVESQRAYTPSSKPNLSVGTRPPNPSNFVITASQENYTPPDVCRPWSAPMSFSGKEKKGSGDPKYWLWASYNACSLVSI
jgi:hypothetical protein